MPDDIQPNKLASMKRDEVIARAQRILDLRGEPPYESSQFGEAATIGEVTEDELAILSEFVYYWRPFLVSKP